MATRRTYADARVALEIDGVLELAVAVLEAAGRRRAQAAVHVVRLADVRHRLARRVAHLSAHCSNGRRDWKNVKKKWFTAAPELLMCGRCSSKCVRSNRNKAGRVVIKAIAKLLRRGARCAHEYPWRKGAEPSRTERSNMRDARRDILYWSSKCCTRTAHVNNASKRTHTSFYWTVLYITVYCVRTASRSKLNGRPTRSISLVRQFLKMARSVFRSDEQNTQKSSLCSGFQTSNTTVQFNYTRHRNWMCCFNDRRNVSVFIFLSKENWIDKFCMKFLFASSVFSTIQCTALSLHLCGSPISDFLFFCSSKYCLHSFSLALAYWTWATVNSVCTETQTVFLFWKFFESFRWVSTICHSITIKYKSF